MDKKILIVEDEAAIQKILAEPLTFAGHEVTTTSDGLEGVNTFHEQAFDLVVLDVMLPKIDGYTVCEMIRHKSRVPIILLTALDTEEAQIEGFDKLADDYTRDDLLNLVWGYDFVGDEKGVNFHIMNLRKKLHVDYIETVRGVGYKIAKEN